MKRLLHIVVFPAVLMFLIGCGGARKDAAPENAPPPPIDENLLSLVPFETDLVVWVDFKTLRATPLWNLVDKVFQSDALKLPAQEAVSPIVSCDEAVLAFMDSDQLGNQLLVITKGDAAVQAAAVNAVRGKEGAAPESAEGFDGVRTDKILMLFLTPNTAIFGNDSVVRMSARAGLKKSRSIIDNPDFASFNTGGGAAARMYYRSGLNTKTVERFKTVAPKINPDAVSIVDGTLTADEGAHIALNLDMETQMDATVFEEETRRMLDALKDNMIVLFLGLNWLRDKVVTSSDKDKVTVDIRLDGQDVENLNQLAERLQKIQALLGKGESEQ
jgi:hypothetical protein